MTTPTKPLTLIVAAASPSLGIGRTGQLPWRLKTELSYFARVTKRLPADAPSTAQNAVIMGRKTWLSIPPRFRPLPGRINVVLSRSPLTGLEGGAIAAASFDDALRKLRELGEAVGRVFVIGGEEVYREACKRGDARRVLLTRVQGQFDCDAFFPVKLGDDGVGEEGWRRGSWEELCGFVGEEVPRGGQEEGGVRFEFEVWER